MGVPKNELSKYCKSFVYLSEICNTVSTCIYEGARNRQRKLTKDTGNAFPITTKSNVLASKKLIESHCFEYVLPAIYSQNPIEMFFGQSRQRVGGNFYIDIGDVIASAKAQHLHQLFKYEIIPDCESIAAVHCVLCASTVNNTDLEVIDETSIKDTGNLLNSSGTMKEKVAYIAGFLTHKFKQHDGDPSEEESCRFLEELNRGSLRVPTLNTVFFVHSAQYTYEHLDESRKNCISYFKRLISHIDGSN